MLGVKIRSEIVLLSAVEGDEKNAALMRTSAPSAVDSLVPMLYGLIYLKSRLVAHTKQSRG
jgi:hypothetical protein